MISYKTRRHCDSGRRKLPPISLGDELLRGEFFQGGAGEGRGSSKRIAHLGLKERPVRARSPGGTVREGGAAREDRL